MPIQICQQLILMSHVIHYLNKKNIYFIEIIKSVYLLSLNKLSDPIQ